MAEYDLYRTNELIGAIEQGEFQASSLFIELFFKKEVLSEARDISLDLIDVPEIPIAAFCSPVVGSMVSRDQGFATKTFTPGYLKPKKSIDPTKLVARNPGKALNTTADKRTMLVMSAFHSQIQSIAARKEWLAVQLVTTGKNIISGEGIETYEIDWNMDSKNIITQSGSTAWSSQNKDTYDPNDDIETYAENAAAPVNVIIMGTKVWKLYRQFKAVKSALDSRRGSSSNLETALKNLGEYISLKGYMGDTAIIVYSGKYFEDKTEKYFLDPMTMVLGNVTHGGLVAYGTIQDTAAAREGLDVASMYPKNYVVPGDPEVEYMQTHSAPQPIPAGINKFVCVKVA
ncbi:major capsid protein [Salmonella enterica]|nr:major capsid protein [Salmonella enterica]EDL5764704.1 major capsid protein [Salmonella enterica subsp. enterica serovar Senftenberg]